MISQDDIARFVVANTEIACPPLVPELRLRLASQVVPIWEATERSLADLGIEPPYWAFCWPGSQALARLLLDEPERVTGRRVLDLASGCGAAAIAASLAGADTVVANDVDRLALAAIPMNAELNGVGLTLEADDVLGSAKADWDLVLAGDVCYEKKFADRAMAWLRELARRDVEVLLADPGRSYLPTSGLEPVRRYDVPTVLDLEDRESRECVVWRVLP